MGAARSIRRKWEVYVRPHRKHAARWREGAAPARPAGRLRRALSYTRPMTDIAALRKSYERAELDEPASAADPMQQFETWLEQAIAAAAARAERDDAGHRRRRRPAVDARRAHQGLRRARHRLVHQLPAAARAASWRSIRSPRCSSTGSSSSASCASKARSRRSSAPSPTPTSRVAPARFAHRRLGVAAERGDRVARDAASPTRRATARKFMLQSAAAAALGRLPAACPTRGSSGRAASRACTTACATGATATPGCASDSRPSRAERARRRRSRLAFPVVEVLIERVRFARSATVRCRPRSRGTCPSRGTRRSPGASAC